MKDEDDEEGMTHADERNPDVQRIESKALCSTESNCIEQKGALAKERPGMDRGLALDIDGM